MAATTTTPPGDNSYLTDRTLTLAQKWNRHVQERPNKVNSNFGILCFNRWVPIVYFFVYLSAQAWCMLVAIPDFHWKSAGWCIVMEIFVGYVFAHVVANWILIHKTDSSYRPKLGEADLDSQLTTIPAFPQTGSNGATTQVELDESCTGTGNASSCQTGCEPRSGLTYRMLVVSAIEGGNVERKSYPYWSWVPCLMCRRLRPPRCHHCTICRRCVLKRDHHCYFTRVCVGVNNQKYFLYFLFWSIFATSSGVIYLLPYGYHQILDYYSYWNLIFPVNVISTFRGNLPALYLHFIIITWGVLFLWMVAIGMFSLHFFLTLKGLTKFEYDHNIKIVDTRSISGRMRSVFGPNWGLPLLIPGYRNGDALEDAVSWPYIKP